MKYQVLTRPQWGSRRIVDQDAVVAYITDRNEAEPTGVPIDTDALGYDIQECARNAWHLKGEILASLLITQQ